MKDGTLAARLWLPEDSNRSPVPGRQLTKANDAQDYRRRADAAVRIPPCAE
jgi:hypothetical protein